MIGIYRTDLRPAVIDWERPGELGVNCVCPDSFRLFEIIVNRTHRYDMYLAAFSQSYL